MREDGRTITTLVTQTNQTEYVTQSLHPEVYRQALKVMLETPEISNRMNHITAALIFAVFGGWLARVAVRSRAFAALVDFSIFLACVTLAGLGVGVLIGGGFIPTAFLPALVFVLLGILFLFLIVLLISLIMWATRYGAAETFETSPRPIVITTREQTRRRF